MTWGVIVVHGVGDTEPGATLGAFVPDYVKGRRLRESAPPETRLLVEPPAELPGRATPPPAPATQTAIGPERRFPMHVREFDIVGAPAGEPRRAVFAEVFWADLSRAGSSTWALLWRTVLLVFDLRHIANIAAAYPKLWAARALRVMLYLVSFVLCGPVAACTAFLLLLLATRSAMLAGYSVFASGVPPQSLREAAVALLGVAAVVAVIVIAGSVYRKKKPWDETWLLFGASFAVAGAVATVVALGRLGGVAGFPWQTGIGEFLARHLMLGSSIAQSSSVTVTHFAFVLGLGYLAFTVIAVLALITFGVWILASLEALARREWQALPALALALAAALLQVLLWVIIGTGLGALALHQFASAPEYQALMSSLLTGVILKLGAAAIIAVCAGIVWLARRAARRYALAGRCRMPRLVLSWLITTALIGLTLTSVVLFAWAFVATSPDLHDWLAPYAGPATKLLVALGLAVSALFTFVGKALHIVFDITSHFHRRLLNPLKSRIEAGEFQIQQRIEARFRRVLQEVLLPGDVTHVTFVAHSQGTIIALDVLWLDWASQVLKDKEVYFVTMGSPITHLYQHYFPLRYPPLPPWCDGMKATVRRWINIFRVDDYIGTRVDGYPGFPENAPPLPKGGHTGYWNDPAAVAAMADYLPR